MGGECTQQSGRLHFLRETTFCDCAVFFLSFFSFSIVIQMFFLHGANSNRTNRTNRSILKCLFLKLSVFLGGRPLRGALSPFQASVPVVRRSQWRSKERQKDGVFFCFPLPLREPSARHVSAEGDRH